MNTRRWMQTVLKEAKKAEDVAMPWHREWRPVRNAPVKPLRLKASA